MTGLVRKATLMGVCGLLAAATALANVPDAGTSDHVNVIPVVGTNAGGVPHPGLAVGGVIRDFAGNPISDAPVVLDFTNCTDIALCDVEIAGSGDVTCVGAEVCVRTDPTGNWSVSILGRSYSTGNGLGPAGGCVQVRAGAGGATCANATVNINTATAYVMNIRGQEDAVQALDLSTYKADWLKATGGAYVLGRIMAFNVPPALPNAFDLAAYKSRFLSNGSANGCPAPDTACF